MQAIIINIGNEGYTGAGYQALGWRYQTGLSDGFRLAYNDFLERYSEA